MKRTTMSTHNRTGMQRSPKDGAALEAAEQNFQPQGTAEQFAQAHQPYIAEADALGTVPAPATPKGMAKGGMTMLAGKRPQLLIDKLGERLAFERGGTRLYDAMLAKHKAVSAKGNTLEIPEDRLRHIREEEAEHALLVVEAIEQLGGDPTAQTPCADLVGVQTMGFVQSLTDPRTTIAHCLNSLLAAELADNAGWELLIELAENVGQDDLAGRFRTALQEEQEHLRNVRQWYRSAVMGELKLMQ